jgi:predicted heme/steroid binding protein
MMRKIGLVLVVLMSVLLYGCAEAEESTFIPDVPTEETLLEFTLTELLEFDGTNGKDAYIAVNGYVYDVTDSSFWRNGGHNGFTAGRDLTDAIINQSPHGLDNLNGVPLIGIIVEE